LTTKTINVNIGDAEFMLDLPDGVSIKEAQVSNGKLVLSISTDLDIPDNTTVVYRNDDLGNTVLYTFQ
jgi:hypothetical protein